MYYLTLISLTLIYELYSLIKLKKDIVKYEFVEPMSMSIILLQL